MFGCFGSCAAAPSCYRLRSVLSRDVRGKLAFWHQQVTPRAPPFIIPDSACAVFLSERQSLLDFLGDLKRTHMCGALRLSDAGTKAVLMGWVNRRRDLGSIIFIDLRDRTGVTQIVFNRELSAAVHEKASALRNEYVIAVIGKVRQRD